MKRLLVIVLAFAALADTAGAQVPNPINAPAVLTPGHVLTASGEQASDSGLAPADILTVSDVLIATHNATANWVGDGTTDNSSACNAVMSGPLASGGRIHIPSGIYVLKGCVLPNARVEIDCDSPDTTVLTLPTNAGTYMIASYGYANNGTTGRQVIIDNCQLNGNSTNQSTENDLVVLRAGNNILRNNFILNTKGHAIRLTSVAADGTTCISAGMPDNKFSNNRIINNSRGGFYGVAGSCGNLTDWRITDNIFNGNGSSCSGGDYQIYSEGSAGTIVARNKMYGQTGCGNVYMASVGGLTQILDNAFDPTTDTANGATAVEDVVVSTGSGGSNFCEVAIRNNSWKLESISLPGSATGFKFLHVTNTCPVNGAYNAGGNTFWSASLSTVPITYDGAHASDAHLKATGNAYSSTSPAPTDPNIDGELIAGKNLSDLPSVSTARSNLGAEAQDADLDALAALSSTGIVKRTGSGTFGFAASGTDYAPATSGSSILKASSGGFANAVSGTDYAPATSGSSILKASSGGFANAVSGTDYAPATSGSSILKASSGGFANAVSGTDYAPATSGSSILKASSGGFANAVSGTDYAPATSGSAILKGNGSGGFSSATSGTDYAPATSGSSMLKGNGSGGFSNASSGTDYAPATSGSAILKGNGSGGFSSATSGTDYAPATSGSSMLKGNGSGGFSNATSGTDYAPATSGSSILKASGGGFANATAGTDYEAPHTTIAGYGITDGVYLLARGNTDLTVPADTSEDTLVTITVPANSIGANGCITVTTAWSYTASTNVKTMRVHYSGAAGTAYLSAVTTANTQFAATLYTKICNRNATNSQIGTLVQGTLNLNAPVTLPTSSVDTTASSTIVITGQKASSGETMTLAHYDVMVSPSS